MSTSTFKSLKFLFLSSLWHRNLVASALIVTFASAQAMASGADGAHATASPQAQGYKYDVNDTSCGGFPKLSVTTFRGSCLGLISAGTMRFPRKILELEPNRYLVTDMGGWDPINRGVLWELDVRSGHARLTKRAEGLLIPHDIQYGPDGNIYIGERGKVTRWKKSELLGSKVVQGEAVTNDLLAEFAGKPDLHPLMKFAFGKTTEDFGDLYVNVGALSDACVKEAPGPCKTVEKSAMIRKFKFDRQTNRWSKDSVVWAKGLRNSMGMVIHPSGTFLQTENSRDFPSVEEPFDEVNLIRPNRHFGWPYCYDFTAASPEWKNINCGKDYSSPYLLVPPHAAPLDLLYYNGAMFPELQGQLLMAWHGYQATGSRVVSYPTDANGLPVLSPSTEWSYNVYTDNGVKRKPAQPRGGNLRTASYRELVSVWNKRAGLRPSGAPVGMTVASNGSILIVEDKNRSVVLLTRSEEPPYEDTPGSSPEEEARIREGMARMTATPELAALASHLNQTVFQPICTACHVGIKGSNEAALRFLIREQWVVPGNPQSPLVVRVTSTDSGRRMPLGGSLSPQQQSEIFQWVGQSR